MRSAWIIFAILGAVTSLLVAQVIQTRLADERLHATAQSLLQLATDIANQSRETLSEIKALSTEACSEADLNGLRYLLYDARYLQDAGRSENGEIKCTALWGRLTEPLSLPEPDWITAAQERLWKNVQGVPDKRIVSDIGMSQNAVTYTRKDVFLPYETSSAQSRALLVSMDGSYVFRDFGQGAKSLVGIMNQPNGLFTSAGRHQQICENRFQICAVVQSDESVNILQQSPMIAAAVMLLGALGGAGGGYAVTNYIRSNRSLNNQLKRALKYQTFRVAYQPIVRLRDRRIVGYEALSRWNDEDGKSVSPAVFIPAIEAMDLLRTLTMNIVRQVLLELGPHLSANRDFYVSINAGVSDLISAEFQRFLVDEVNKYGVEPHRIVLEITERASTEMIKLTDAVTKFRALGFKVFIDDFGTGYSGIAYLANMPVDAVKVDRMFTSAVGTDSVHARMLTKICGMIADVGGEILVEGVETEEQATILNALYPAANAQGWFFGRPHEGTQAIEKIHQQQ